jgi:putative membrane protein
MQITERLTTGVTTEKETSPRLEWVKTLILFGLALYFSHNILSGNLANYINQRFAWLSYVAIAIFLMLGLASAYGLWQGHYRRSRSAYGVDHQRLNWRMLSIVSIPLLIGTLIPSQPLGVEAINGNISMSVATYDSAGALSKDPLTRNVLDWLRIFSRSATPASFDGEEADLVGFIYREPDFPEGYFMVTRFTVSCCVADAGAVGLPVYWPEAGELADGEWVRVRGVFETGTFRDVKMPILQPAELEPIDQPDHPYLYT